MPRAVRGHRCAGRKASGSSTAHGMSSPPSPPDGPPAPWRGVEGLRVSNRQHEDRQQVLATANTVFRRLSVNACALASGALWMAGPAVAQPASGAYTATVTQATPPRVVEVGQRMDVMLNTCGSDCTKPLTSAETAWFGGLRRQGNSWTGPLQNAHFPSDCNGTLDDAAQTPRHPLPIGWRDALTRNS
jgi:hypothetical protein